MILFGIIYISGHVDTHIFMNVIVALMLITSYTTYTSLYSDCYQLKIWLTTLGDDGTYIIIMFFLIVTKINDFLTCTQPFFLSCFIILSFK